MRCRASVLYSLAGWASASSRKYWNERWARDGSRAAASTPNQRVKRLASGSQ
jgi:hypothetical protein